MNEFSDEDRRAICETFERLLESKGHEAALRKVIETDAGFDQGFWLDMAKLGLTGVMVASEHGGLSGTVQEVEALMEVAGAFLYSGPYISTCVIAPALLEAAIDTEFSRTYLQDISNGQSVFAIAGCGLSGDWTDLPTVTAQKSGQNWTLHGESHFVVHGRNANAFLVSAMIDGELAVFCLEADAPGLALIKHVTDDKTLRLSSLFCDGASAMRLGGVGHTEWTRSLHLGLVALAGYQAGAGRKIFDLTINYLNTRYQFGQPIGRFQALKHIAADLLIEVESSSTAARHAARALASHSSIANILTYLAAFTCADNFRHVASEAIQLHGGIAYTMEHSAHLYWRRAQTTQYLFGASDRFRDLYLCEMENSL